jgi:hypothetical protein
MDLIHPIPYLALVFAIVGVVLLVPRPWRRLLRKPPAGADPCGREWRRYRQRVAVYRSAGISLLIVAGISYLTA